MKILVLEDDQLTRIALANQLSQFGSVSSFSECFKLESSKYDISFIDLHLENSRSGLDFIKMNKAHLGHMVMLTGQESSAEIERAYREGVNDYLVKPLDYDVLLKLIKRVSLKRKIEQLVANFDSLYCTKNKHDRNEILRSIEKVGTCSSMLLLGETGTGKSHLAKMVAKFLFDKDIVNINCAEIPPSLFESELFGHKRGAFTGAEEDKVGKIELANNGVLFLDEISSLRPDQQRKLLKVIEEKKFTRVGCHKEIKSNFFLMTATCDDLSELVHESKFREDLYFRINQIELKLRPLRDRPEDVDHIMNLLMKKTKKLIFSDEAQKKINEYHWPGNSRELKHFVEYLQGNPGGLISVNDLPRKLIEKAKKKESFSLYQEAEKILREKGLAAYSKHVERAILHQKLIENNQKVRKTIKDLKISNSMFYRIQNS